MSKIVTMLNGIRIHTGNSMWRKILIDLGASVMDDSSLSDVDIDSLNIPKQITPLELKSIILNAVEDNHQNILKKVFKKNIKLPRLQMDIVVLLFRTKGMSMNDMKAVLGYSPDIATHTIDTAIYELRKTYGKDFIKNKNGKYIIGGL
ncbi:MAG TPA: hypothetical protein PKJ33_04270 [Alphaproteobacteria bacterium]|nr:hypothetical protein [Alphaproteobacteria bacterium]